MLTLLGDDVKGGMGRKGGKGRRRWKELTVLFVALCLPAVPAFPALPAQIAFDQAISDLSSNDPNTRFRAAQLLKEAAYPESAVPLAKAITDPQDEVQIEAIAAELNVFLAEKIVPKKRLGLVIEVRNAVLAEPVFSTGPLAIGPRPVPAEVLAALRTAMHDDNPRVGIEALYAFGVLAVEPSGPARQELLLASGPDLVGFLGAADVAERYAAARVIGRVFQRRAGDPPVDASIGDAVITALNDRDHGVKVAAMEALGWMRYDRGLQALTELFQYYVKGDLGEGALDAIARIAHTSSTPIFVANLTAKSSNLRVAAIEGLSRVRDASAMQAIQSAVGTDRSDAVILAAAFASAMLANAPIDSIGEALARPKQRDQAKQYLIELAPGRAAAFGRFLKDPDARLRADAIDALALGGDAAALPLVEPLQQDQDPKVARAAERAIAKLRQATARPVS